MILSEHVFVFRNDRHLSSSLADPKMQKYFRLQLGLTKIDIKKGRATREHNEEKREFEATLPYLIADRLEQTGVLGKDPRADSITRQWQALGGGVSPEVANAGRASVALSIPHVAVAVYGIEGTYNAYKGNYGRLGISVAGMLLSRGVGNAIEAGLTQNGLPGFYSTSGNFINVFRVEGANNTRLLINESGQVAILGDKMLFLNFGSRERALEFLSKRLGQGMPDATIKSFSVQKSFIDELRASAVLESEAAANPGRPLVVDITKAADQFGLRAEQIEELNRAIILGSGKVDQ